MITGRSVIGRNDTQAPEGRRAALHLIHGDGVFDGEHTAACPAERSQMSGATGHPSKVAGKRAYVSTRAALDGNVDLGFPHVADGPARHIHLDGCKLEGLTLSRGVVCPNTANGFGGVCRRRLHELARERWNHLADALDRGDRSFMNHDAGRVLGVSLRAKAYRRVI